MMTWIPKTNEEADALHEDWLSNIQTMTDALYAGSMPFIGGLESFDPAMYFEFGDLDDYLGGHTWEDERREH